MLYGYKIIRILFQQIFSTLELTEIIGLSQREKRPILE
ncbi:hypothetical protein NC99_09460 [Sunxiuqinia dokdonensis]|uniref:Uncharacterized protein n=1 Tax=Sunxiuqinia dokdonensis TaxID=1409788 RepID=A0A0L8VCR8_9BACT|nr:hypothetical protein NC99_09460 [Sunxiuqinia dokdonensis]